MIKLMQKESIAMAVQDNHCTKNEFSINDFFSKCDQIRRILQIWSHLLKKFFMENFISSALNLKLTSQGILHYYSWSVDLSESFSQLIMPLFIFSQYFFQKIFTSGKVWGYPTLHIS